MIEICKKEECTGCWACVNCCTKGAISMQEDNLGHLYPKINTLKCVDCGLCAKICPTNNPIKLESPITAYAGWDKDIEEYKTSTSGGAASAFSRYIIRLGGVVYGCACLNNVDVRHIRIEKESELYLLKGSKYVQSSIYDCYRVIKSDLIKERKVLFIGTPCQVAGLKSFLRKEYENLYTVDLICHGVPSLSYLKQYAFKKGKSHEISQVKFRDGNGMYLLLLLRDKVLYKSSLWKERYKDTYFNTFIDGFTYRDSCYKCRYAKAERGADITIGDFWGLKDDLPLPHPNGCSCILPITSKGYMLANSIRENFNLFERNVLEAVNGNDQLRNPKYLSLRIKIFRKIHNVMGIAIAYKLLMADRILRYKLSKIKNKIIKK